MKRNNNSTNVGRFALSCVAAATLSVAMGDAWALGLGRLSVQSSLGEGLHAEIDVTTLTAEEAASLRARVASPDAYRVAGIEYNSVLPVAQISLQRRADGRSYLRIQSDRVVQEPFVDLILELSWSSGRLVREYTLLFDPPSNRVPAVPGPLTAPIIAQPAAPAKPLAAARPPVVVAAPAAEAASPARRRAAPAPASEPPPAAPDEAPGEVPVRPGDSLSRIASRVLPAGVSLDQMVVSLYRANPEAFMGDNMNRLKAGVVLSIPGAEQARSVPTDEARRLIYAQSADFASYRQRLAKAAGEAVEEPNRQSSGRVEAAVEDRTAAAAPTPDRLTLSKGAVAAGRAGAGAPEEKIAKQREQQESSARIAELSRNLEELKSLSVPAGAAAAPGAAASAAAPAGIAVASAMAEPASAAASEAVLAAAAPADAAASAAEPPLLVASAPAPEAAASQAAKPVPVPPPVVVAQEEPGLLDTLLDNPMVLPLGGGLVLLLGGLVAYRLVRTRKKTKESAETSFLESRLQPDSFFGATGGGHVDTSSTPPSASLNYSLSQIDAIGDVDPVAEADVYLAYGRDLQAEEILKEALRTDPDRLALHTKMLEVYAKRRDSRGFEVLAGQLRSMTGGQGEDWEKACELGASIDPDNPLYRSAEVSAASMRREEPFVQPEPAPAFPPVAAAAPMPLAAAAVAAAVVAPVEASTDLDLDLSEPLDAPALAERGALDLEATRPLPSDVPDLGLGGLDLSSPAPSAAPVASVEMESLSFDLSSDEPALALPKSAPAPASAPVAASGNSMDFDLGGLTLDFDLPGAAPAAAPAAPSHSMTGGLDELGDLGDLDLMVEDEGGDPLARKLELADEFIQIGDYDGARELLLEVVSQAQGPLKAKAQGLLDDMA